MINDNGKEKERTECTSSKNNLMTTNGEQVSHSNNTSTNEQIVHHSNTTSPIKQIFHHTSESTNDINRILNNDDAGCGKQRKHVDTTVDFISVSDKAGSMSLSHEKVEIAVLILQLFQLKNSFALIMNSHTQEKLHSSSLKNYPFGKVKGRGGGLQYLKSENQFIIKESLHFNGDQTEFMCKYIWYIIIHNTMFYSPSHIKIVYQASNQ